MAAHGVSLESWLNKATNPSNRQEDWEYVMGFCDQINKELEGPQISARLLAHKIQSPQEWEALQALMVLETCMKNCGRRFHIEVGKFRFLNELIKVVSPKFLGDRVSEKVKTKVIEMLYSWTVSLPDDTKIFEAYEMLKSQGIVLSDPAIRVDTTLMSCPSPRPANPVFDDEKKSKRLAALLKSKKSEDLQEANRLIKNMVKEDEARTQKAKKQKSTLEAVNNSIKVLNEMLAHFTPEDSSDGDKELIRELYGDCDKLRQTVFQLATETEDNDSSLGDILQASDDLCHVMNSYKRIVEGQIINGDTKDGQLSFRQGRSNQSEILIDLVSLDVQSVPVPEQQTSLPFSSDLLCGPAASEPQPSAPLSLLDEELLSLDLNKPAPVGESTNLANHLTSVQFQNSHQDFFHAPSPSAPSFGTPSFFPGALFVTGAPVSPEKTTAASSLSYPGFLSMPPSTSAVLPPAFSTGLNFAAPAALPQSFSSASSASAVPVAPQASTSPGASNATSASRNLQDLALLDLGSPKITPGVMDFSSFMAPAPTLSSSLGVTSSSNTSLLLGGMQESFPSPAKSQTGSSPLFHALSPILPLSQASPAKGQDMSLANVFVPLDAIKPSKVCPVTAYDKHGVRVLLHFATDCPAGRPDVLVMVASILNTAPLPLRNISLQAAVPKTMKVRLQAPSGTELAPFNPMLPPAAITQVMLLSNPLKEKVRMRFKLTFTLREQLFSEVGEVSEFPPADRWGAL